MRTFDVARVVDIALSNEQEDNSDKETCITLWDEKPEREDKEDLPSSPPFPSE